MKKKFIQLVRLFISAIFVFVLAFFPSLALEIIYKKHISIEDFGYTYLFFIYIILCALVMYFFINKYFGSDKIKYLFNKNRTKKLRKSIINNDSLDSEYKIILYNYSFFLLILLIYMFLSLLPDIRVSRLEFSLTIFFYIIVIKQFLFYFKYKIKMICNFLILEIFLFIQYFYDKFSEYVPNGIGKLINSYYPVKNVNSAFSLNYIFIVFYLLFFLFIIFSFIVNISLYKNAKIKDYKDRTIYKSLLVLLAIIFSIAFVFFDSKSAPIISLITAMFISLLTPENFIILFLNNNYVDTKNISIVTKKFFKKAQLMMYIINISWLISIFLSTKKFIYENSIIKYYVNNNYLVLKIYLFVSLILLLSVLFILIPTIIVNKNANKIMNWIE